MRITDNMRPDCISVCFYQIRYEHPHHPQCRYNALHVAACFETKWDFGQEICTHLPKGKDDISALSYVNPLVVYDFNGSVSDAVRLLYPLHRAIGFQSFRDIFLFRKCGYKRPKHLLRLPVYLCQLLVLLSGGQQKEYEPFDSYSRFLPAMPVAACFSDTALYALSKSSTVF